MMYWGMLDGMNNKYDGSKQKESSNTTFRQNAFCFHKKQNYNDRNNHNRYYGKGKYRGGKSFNPQGHNVENKENTGIVNFSPEVPGAFSASIESVSGIPEYRISQNLLSENAYNFQQDFSQNPINFHQKLLETFPEGLMQFLESNHTPPDLNGTSLISFDMLKTIYSFFLKRSQNFFHFFVLTLKNKINNDFYGEKITFFDQDMWNLSRFLKTINEADFCNFSLEMPDNRINDYLKTFNIYNFNLKDAYESSRTNNESNQDFFDLFLNRFFFWPCILPIVKNVLWNIGREENIAENYRKKLQKDAGYTLLNSVVGKNSLIDLISIALENPFLCHLAMCIDHTNLAHSFYFAAIAYYILFTQFKNVTAGICARDQELNISFDFASDRTVPAIGSNNSNYRLFAEILHGRKIKTFYLVPINNIDKKFMASVFLNKKNSQFYLPDFQIPLELVNKIPIIHRLYPLIQINKPLTLSDPYK